MINHNNHHVPAPEWTTTNRAFRYGDGLFETILWHNGRAPYLQYHWQRLSQGLAYLGLDVPEYFNETYIAEQLALLAKENHLDTTGRFRITVYRDSTGTYKTAENTASFIIECQPIDATQLEFAEKGLSVGLYKENTKAPGLLANLKTTSALLYVLASQYANQQGWDDALLLNTNGRVIEATSSNLFLAKGTNLHTPPLKEGPLDGVMRKVVFQMGMQEGYGVSSGPVEPSMLLDADEIILTNAIQGIRWVGQYGGKTYGNKVARALHGLWVESIK